MCLQMSEEWLFVYLDFWLAVYSSWKLHWHRSWFPKSQPPPQKNPPLPSQNLFALSLPWVSPRKSAHHSTWLILNGCCKEMCLFINTNPAPPVYCSHGSNHLLNKQLLCLPVWVVCLYPVQGLGRTWTSQGLWHYIVTVLWRYALLVCDLVEVAEQITGLFGLTVKSFLAEYLHCSSQQRAGGEI